MKSFQSQHRHIIGPARGLGRVDVFTRPCQLGVRTPFLLLCRLTVPPFVLARWCPRTGRSCTSQSLRAPVTTGRDVTGPHVARDAGTVTSATPTNNHKTSRGTRDTRHTGNSTHTCVCEQTLGVGVATPLRLCSVHSFHACHFTHASSFLLPAVSSTTTPSPCKPTLSVSVVSSVQLTRFVTLDATGWLTRTFSTSLPASLQGLVSPHEFAASIRRCNDAYQSGPLWLARLIVLVGLVAWVVCISQISRVGGGLGPTPALLDGAFPCLFICFFLVATWSNKILHARIQKLSHAVAQEHEVYNTPARRAAAPNQPPISWSLTVTSTGRFHSRTAVCQIDIQVGGPYLAGPVVVVAQPGQPQPPQQPPQYQPYSGQAYQAAYEQPAQPVYVAPVSGQPGGPVVYQPQAPPQNSHRDSSREPLLAGDNSTAEGYGGHEQAAAPVPPAVVATCSQCGRTTANQEDRFCASCGGQYVR